MARYLIMETLDDVETVYGGELEAAAQGIAGLAWLGGCRMELKGGVYGNRFVVRTRTKCIKWVRAAAASLGRPVVTVRVTGSARKAEALAKSLKPLYAPGKLLD